MTDTSCCPYCGLPLRDARRGLSAIAGELSQRDDGLADLARQGTAGASPAPRLLGAFDPLLLGWASRAPVLGGHQGIVTVNGLFRPFALVGGKAAATWSLSGGQLTLTPFAPLAAADEAALLADADDVLRFLGLPAARGR